MAISKIILNGITQMDITDSTASQADVKSGKYFYDNDGVRKSGVGSSLNGWQRPQDYPNYDEVIISDQVLYISVSTKNMEHPFIRFKTTSSGTIILNCGTLNNGIYSVIDSQTITSNANTVITIPTDTEYKYLVYRLTSNKPITQFLIESSANVNVGDYKASTASMSIVEIYGSLPYTTKFSLRGVAKIKSCSLFNMGDLQSLERAFNECYSLENIKITGLTESLTSMYFAFQSSRCIKYIDLDGYNTKSVTSAEALFYNTNCLEYFNGILDLSSFNGTGANLNYACRPLPLIPEKLGKVTQLNSAFREMATLERVIKPDWDTSNCTRIDYAFYTDWSLIEVDLSNLDLSKVTTEGNAAQVFSGCLSLNKAILPNTLAYIGASFFNNCQSLQEIHFLQTTPPTLANVNAFNGVPSTCVFYVPYSEDHSILAAYQAASNWSTFASKIVEEPQETS